MPSPTDKPKVAAEYQKKIAAFNCVMDYVTTPKKLTYDAAKKTLTFHFTLESTMNSGWIGYYLRDEMSSTFPELAKHLKTQNI